MSVDKVPCVRAEIRQIQDMEANIEDVFNQCHKMTADIFEYSKDPTADLIDFKDTMVELAEMQKELSGLAAAAEHIQGLAESEEEDRSVVIGQFNQIISDRVEESFNSVANKIIMTVDNFITQSEKNDQITDEDLLVTGTKETYKDPLTKLTMKDPVKSTTCNHSYERHSILQYLENHNKCPYSGCQSYLARSELIDDLVLKRALENMQTDE